MKYYLIIASCCLSLLTSAKAVPLNQANTAQEQQRIALVIGNSAYPKTLRQPVNDAHLMTKTLSNLGFHVIEVTDVTQKKMNRAIATFRSKLNANTVALFYFSGHGLQIEGHNYLVPVDARINSKSAVVRQTVNVDNLLKQLKNNMLSIIVLDACRSFPAVPGSLKANKQGLAKIDAPTNTFIAYSAFPDMIADDEVEENGLFTRELLHQINKYGLSLEAIFKRLSAGVSSRSGYVQTPWHSSSTTHEFYFNPHKETLEHQVEPGMSPDKIFRDCPDCPDLVIVPAGSFNMGSPESEDERFDTEGPVHPVTITHSFALGKTEITRGQFAIFANETHYDAGNNCWTFEDEKWEERSGRNWKNPGYQQDDNHPVACVNWNDAKAYIEWISKKTGKNYGLPTESEWEYAARADSPASLYWGDDSDQACQYANVMDTTGHLQIPGITWDTHDCSDGYAYTAPVASFKPNAFALNDMIGSLWEWTSDSYYRSYVDALNDGSERQGDGINRVIRGGSWSSNPQFSRSASRDFNSSNYRVNSIGFRVSRTLP
jgi:formylglycine-generating enzyme required for sulfatase activity